MDEPGRPLPPDRIPKRPRWRRAPQNPIDIVLRKVFEAMEMDVEGNDDGQINRIADGEAKADGVPHEVEIGVDERAHRVQHESDEALAIAQRMLKEKTTEYLADEAAYKARITHLESMEAERDATVEQARVANLHALELSMANQELQSQLKVLRQNPFEAEIQALQQETEGLHDQLREANQHLADYNSTKDNMQKLQEENEKLKEYFWTMLKERKDMRSNCLQLHEPTNMNRNLKASNRSGIAMEECRICCLHHGLTRRRCTKIIGGQRICQFECIMKASIGSTSRRQISIGMWKRSMHIHTTCLAKSSGQIHTQWLAMDRCVAIARVHLALRDAIKLDHVGANSIHNLSSTI